MTAPATPAASAKPPSLWEDFVDVLYAPAGVFERRREGRFGAALLVATVVFAAAFFATRPLMTPIMDRVFQQQIAQAQARGMSAEQIEAARPMMERVGDITMTVAGVAGMPVLILASALVLWLVAKLVDSRASYGQVAMVVTYANVPRLIGLIVGAALLATRDPATLPPLPQMSVGPALLLGADASPVLTMFLTRFDVFTLWVTGLSAVGLAVVGKVSRGKAFAAALIVWVLATLAAVAQAWGQSA